jgi:hypothetical protein
MTNAIEVIAEWIGHQFGITPGRFTLYEIWPRGSPGWGHPNVRRVDLDDGPTWIDSSKAEITAMVGGPLAELPLHDELHGQVLAAGGGVMEERWRPIFEAVRVSDLPLPHNPARCQHGRRFGPILERTREAGLRGFGAELEAGGLFLDSLTPADLRACRFHKADWKAIADESVRILDRLGAAEPDDYASEASRSRLSKRDRHWLYSLFRDPIFIGGGSYTNGQHRGCALRFSGAEHAAVVTGDESLGEESADWMYQGDG